MATWFVQVSARGEKTVLYRDRNMFKPAGTCSPGTSMRLIMEWLVNEAGAADVIVTDEGTFALPFRAPTKWESRC